MVVVASVATDAGQAPLVTRVQNASGNSFQLRVQRADGSTDPVPGVNVHYFVVEEGVYTQAEHGVTMEAVTFTSTVTDYKNSWIGESSSYSNSYTNPVVVGQVMTANDDDFSVFWARGSSRGAIPSSSVLYVGKHVGEDADRDRSDETIGYVVIETGSGTIEGREFAAGVGRDIVRGPDNSPPYSYSLSGLTSATAAVVSSAAMDGNDGGWAVLYGASPLSTSTLNLAVEEDQEGDTERRHTTEQVAYLVFGSQVANNDVPDEVVVDDNVVVNEDLAFGNRFLEIIVIGADKGATSPNVAKPYVAVVDKGIGELLAQFLAYEETFTGGVRVATGDLTGDGVDEIITAPGRGREPEIRVFTQQGVELTDFRTLAYDAAFDGGVYVAVGDVVGDGLPDIVTSQGYFGTEVRVFENVYASTPANPLVYVPDLTFEAFPGFTGGAVVDVADMGDFGTVPEKAEIIVGNGPVMRSTVKVFDVTSGGVVEVRTFLPFSDSYQGGVFIDLARVNDDAIPDLIVGQGMLGTSQVEVWDGANPGTRLSDFTAYSGQFAPVRVAGLDRDRDGIVDFAVTGQGPDGETEEIRQFRPLTGELVDSLFESEWDIGNVFFGNYFLDVIDNIDYDLLANGD
jgi:hypothetical protein